MFVISQSQCISFSSRCSCPWAGCHLGQQSMWKAEPRETPCYGSAALKEHSLDSQLHQTSENSAIGTSRHPRNRHPCHSSMSLHTTSRLAIQSHCRWHAHARLMHVDNNSQAAWHEHWLMSTDAIVKYKYNNTMNHATHLFVTQWGPRFADRGKMFHVNPKGNCCIILSEL